MYQLGAPIGDDRWWLGHCRCREAWQASLFGDSPTRYAGYEMMGGGAGVPTEGIVAGALTRDAPNGCADGKRSDAAWECRCGDSWKEPSWDVHHLGDPVEDG